MDIGAQLRSSREGKRLSLETVARTIRVQPRVLVAIERNDSAAIPPRPFGRGFVRAYAREVGLNPDQTVRDYFGQFAPPADAPVAEPVSREAGARRLPCGVFPALLIGTLAIAIVLIGAGCWCASRSNPRETRPSWARAAPRLRWPLGRRRRTTRGSAARAGARGSTDTRACDHRRHRSHAPRAG